MVDSTAAYERGTEVPSSSTENGARESAKRGLGAIIRTLDGVEDAGPEHASVLLKMGAHMQEAGDYSEAEELFRRALAIGERTLGPDNPALLPALTSLAAAHIMCGKFEEAKPLVIRGLAVSESGLAEHDPDLPIVLNDLARLCLKESAHAVAEPLLLRLLTLKRSKGEDHPEVATVLASLATVRQALGRHESAEQLWRQVLQIRERTLAPNHFALATALEHLAESCSARGKIGEALKLFERALSIRYLTLGAGHSSLRVSRERIADLQLQASEESLDASATESPAPELETYRLLSADHSVVSAPTPVRLRSAVTQRKSTAPVAEREPFTKNAIAPPPPTPVVAKVSPIDAQPLQPEPVPYRDVILSIQKEIEDDYESEVQIPRIAQVFTSIAASIAAALRQRPKAAAISGGAVVLLAVLATVALGGSESGQSEAAEEASPSSEAVSVSGRPTRDISTRPVVLANDPAKAPATGAAAATPVSSSLRARVADQRSPAKKPTDRRGQSSGVSIPNVSSALLVGFDSVVRARIPAPRGAGEAFAVELPPLSGAARRPTFGREEEVIAPQRARLIGTMPTPRVPDQLMDVQGEVGVRFEVDASGRPVMSSLSVLNSPSIYLTNAVLRVIPGLQFEPARSGGPDSKAVADLIQVEFQFRPTK